MIFMESKKNHKKNDLFHISYRKKINKNKFGSSDILIVISSSKKKNTQKYIDYDIIPLY